jgi:hypothetical protein
MKALKQAELERRKAQAARFMRDVKHDGERAEEIEDESLEDYSARRRVQLLNPTGGKVMARKTQTREELQERVRELEGENESLQDQLDAIADIVVSAEADEEDEEEDED